jgi:hypothetical protein
LPIPLPHPSSSRLHCDDRLSKAMAPSHPCSTRRASLLLSRCAIRVRVAAWRGLLDHPPSLYWCLFTRPSSVHSPSTILLTPPVLPSATYLSLPHQNPSQNPTVGVIRSGARPTSRSAPTQTSPQFGYNHHLNPPDSHPPTHGVSLTCQGRFRVSNLKIFIGHCLREEAVGMMTRARWGDGSSSR